MSLAIYDEFFYNGKTYSIDILIKAAKKSHGAIGCYQNEILCPECKKARLKFTNATRNKRAYLSTINLKEHEDWCSYKYKLASKIEVKNFFSKLKNNEIEDKMNSIVRKLFQNKEKNSIGNIGNYKNTDNLFLINVKKYNSNKKVIPQKSLNLYIDIKEFSKNEDIYIFYAKEINFQYVKAKTNDKCSLLQIITKANQNIDIYGTNININENLKYNFVCIGYFNKYKKIQLLNSKSIKIFQYE